MIVYVKDRQALPDVVADATAGREIVARTAIRGMTYVEIYGLRADPAGEAADT